MTNRYIIAGDEICFDKETENYYDKPKRFEWLDGKRWVKKQPKNWDGNKESKRILDNVVLKTSKGYIEHLEGVDIPIKIRTLENEVKETCRLDLVNFEYKKHKGVRWLNPATNLLDNMTGVDFWYSSNKNLSYDNSFIKNFKNFAKLQNEVNTLGGELFNLKKQLIIELNKTPKTFTLDKTVIDALKNKVIIL